jgi:hypothetical protein
VHTEVLENRIHRNTHTHGRRFLGVKFVAVAMLLVILSSSAFGVSLGSKQISGTEFVLLENTEQCLTDCEAWVEWSLTEGVASDVQVPVQKDTEFSFDLVTPKGMQGLEDFGVEVWEEQQFEVKDYCDEEYQHSFPTKDLDVASCEALDYCVTVGLDCNCTAKRRVECGTHFETRLVKVADDFYGFKAKVGRVYRLRVWGEKRAGLTENSIDWQPTFFGQKIEEWAWWHSSWDYKLPITLGTSGILTGDVTQDFVIPIDVNSDSPVFWAGVKSDGGDVRFVASDETTEFDFYFEQFDYDNQKMVAWVEVTDTFSATTDMTINLYFGNSSAATSQTFRRSVYPDIYLGGWDFNETTGTIGYDVVDSDANNLTHTNTPTLDSNGQVDGAIKFEITTNEHSLNATYLDGGGSTFSFSMWFAHQQTFDSGSTSDPYIVKKDNDASNKAEMSFGQADGKLLYTMRTDGTSHSLASTTVSWTADTWYQVIGTFDATLNDMNLYINGAYEANLSEAMAVLAPGTTDHFYISRDSSGMDGNQDAVRIFNRVLSMSEVALIYAAENGALAEMGSVESPILDLNISTINGVPFSTNPTFGHSLDGNITIDFNIYHRDNTHPLSIDLNYSTSTTQGGGTAIVEDLNLSSAICPDQNFADGVSECSYSWDYSLVTDGNYYILGELQETILTDFNASEDFFTVSNDVNLRINIPLDESTETALNMTTYSFTVEILDGNTVSTYAGQTDVNYFAIPLNTAYFVVVSIDSNVTADYYGKDYYLKFETAQEVSTLTPYLVPVTGGIEAVFYTKNALDLSVGPNITIKVFKSLAGGRTQMAAVETDAAGTGTLPFVEGDTYELEVYDADDVLLFTETIVANFTSYYIYIDTEEITWTEPTIEYITITGLPDLRTVAIGSNGFDFNIDVSVTGGTLANAWYTVRNDDGNVYFDTNNFADFNKTMPNEFIKNKMEVRVIVYVKTASGLVKQQTWAFVPYDASGYNLIANLRGPRLRTEFGCSTNINEPCFVLLILSAFITIAVVVSTGMGLTGDKPSLGIIAAIFLGLFTYLTWIPVAFFILACLAVFAALVLSRRV